MPDQKAGVLVWLFGFGADIAARRAIDARLAQLDSTTKAIRRDHALDDLIEDIESIQANGAAAMGSGGE